MTLGEFKAWLEGFEVQNTGYPPSLEQWELIKQKMAEIRSINHCCDCHRSQVPISIPAYFPPNYPIPNPIITIC